MASFSDKKEVRLRIQDPADVIDILEATPPATPAPQTAYLYQAAYYSTTKTSGASLGDYFTLPLLVSDARIEGWIDQKGVDYATKMAIISIIATLSSRFQIVKNTEGADTTEFAKINDLLNFYKALKAEYVNESGPGQSRIAKSVRNCRQNEGLI